MRFLYATLGVLGGVVGLGFAYLFLALLMLMGGAKGNMQHVILYVLFAFVVASMLSLIGGVMNPRRPAARGLLTASGAVWTFCAVLLGVLSLADTSSAGVLTALKFAGLVALPSLLPFAALYVAKRADAPA